MTVENLPVFFLIMIGIGVIIIVIGVIGLASIHEELRHEIGVSQPKEAHHLEELFSYFLQEEEKKNQDFRNEILEDTRNKQKKEEGQVFNDSSRGKNKISANKIEEQILDEIITSYQNGQSVEEIAKKLKKGIGEVKLIISLYSMK